jgi:hypothetical protein
MLFLRLGRLRAKRLLTLCRRKKLRQAISLLHKSRLPVPRPYGFFFREKGLDVNKPVPSRAAMTF